LFFDTGGDTSTMMRDTKAHACTQNDRDAVDDFVPRASVAAVLRFSTNIGSLFLGPSSNSFSSDHAMSFCSLSFLLFACWSPLPSDTHPLLLRLRNEVVFLGVRFSSMGRLFSWKASVAFGTQRLRSQGRSLASLIAALSWFPSSAAVRSS